MRGKNGVARDCDAPMKAADVDDGKLAVQLLLVSHVLSMRPVQAVPPATLATLQSNPTDAAAGATAVGAIMQKLGVTQLQAIGLLTSLSQPAVQADLVARPQGGAGDGVRGELHG